MLCYVKCSKSLTQVIFGSVHRQCVSSFVLISFVCFILLFKMRAMKNFGPRVIESAHINWYFCMLNYSPVLNCSHVSFVTSHLCILYMCRNFVFSSTVSPAHGTMIAHRRHLINIYWMNGWIIPLTSKDGLYYFSVILIILIDGLYYEFEITCFD